MRLRPPKAGARATCPATPGSSLVLHHDAGFVDNAEVINSRAAMIGFFALIALEAVRAAAEAWGALTFLVGLTLHRAALQVSNTPFLTMLGYEIGNGIDIGF